MPQTRPVRVPRTTTSAEWFAEGERRFGTDRRTWPFQCPVCGHVATANDYQAAGAPEGAVGFSCIGRFNGSKREAFANGEGPCNYAGGGLFQLNPVTIQDGEKTYQYFEFAPESETPQELATSALPAGSPACIGERGA